MGRSASIWWRASKKAWFVKINGKQVRLSADKKEAQALFHKLKAAQADEKPIQPQELLAYDMAFKFVAWCKHHRAERTAEGYRDHLIRFFDWLPNGKSILASELKPYHVIEYIDAHEWGNDSKRLAAGAVQRCFKWAVSVGILDNHPCISIPKPKGGRRETPMTEAEYKLILKHSRPDFRDVVTFAWESGARPHEIRIMKPEYVQGDRVVFPVVKSKGKRRSRVIHLNEKASEIINRRCKTAVDWVFTNARGKQWSAGNINNRLERLREKVGRKVALYDARHAFTERLLDKGIDHLTVAALLGHTNGQMVASVYSHRNQAVDHLKAALNGGK